MGGRGGVISSSSVATRTAGLTLSSRGRERLSRYDERRRTLAHFVASAGVGAKA